MHYGDTLDYLMGQLPMYQRIGAAAYKANLDNTIALSNHLNHPEQNFRSIHVAGTNGKGSVSHMLASVFQAGGMTTGLTTSPHLKDFRERIRINGVPISKEEVVAFVARHRSFFNSIHPSFFEMAMAMAFDHFSSNSVDVAVVETGLGGRLDSSNIVTPLVSVITNIGMDHTHLLGDSLQAIAGEKAGIIKPGIPVVIGRNQPEVMDVFMERAAALKAPVTVASEIYALLDRVPFDVFRGAGQRISLSSSTAGPSDHFLDLSGYYQAENLMTVLAVLDVLGDERITPHAIASGLSRVAENTGLRGRWDIIGRSPLVVCDTAHNADGVEAVLGQLHDVPHNVMHVVLGMVDDKDRAAVLRLFPRNAVYYFCRPDVPRGLDAKKLASDASFFANLEGKAYDSVAAAFNAARAAASQRDLIFVGGSTFVVAEVL